MNRQTETLKPPGRRCLCHPGRCYRLQSRFSISRSHPCHMIPMTRFLLDNAAHGLSSFLQIGSTPLCRLLALWVLYIIWYYSCNCMPTTSIHSCTRFDIIYRVFLAFCRRLPSVVRTGQLIFFSSPLCRKNLWIHQLIASQHVTPRHLEVLQSAVHCERRGRKTWKTAKTPRTRPRMGQKRQFIPGSY